MLFERKVTPRTVECLKVECSVITIRGKRVGFFLKKHLRDILAGIMNIGQLLQQSKTHLNTKRFRTRLFCSKVQQLGSGKAWRIIRLRMEKDLQMRIAGNTLILNNQSWRADRVMIFQLGCWSGD